MGLRPCTEAPNTKLLGLDHKYGAFHCSDWWAVAYPHTRTEGSLENTGDAIRRTGRDGTGSGWPLNSASNVSCWEVDRWHGSAIIAADSHTGEREHHCCGVNPVTSDTPPPGGRLHVAQAQHARKFEINPENAHRYCIGATPSNSTSLRSSSHLTFVIPLCLRGILFFLVIEGGNMGSGKRRGRVYWGLVRLNDLGDGMLGARWAIHQ